MRRVLLVLCLVFLASPVWGLSRHASFEQAMGLVQEAQLQSGPQRQAKMLQAAALLEAIAQEGIHNGYLEYNLGNAYFEAGLPAKALVHYRRALPLIPASFELKSNLEAARSKLGLAEPRPAWWQELGQSLWFWQEHLGLQSKQMLFLGLYLLGWSLLAWRLLQPQRVPVALLWLLLALCLPLGWANFSALHQVTRQDLALVVEADCQARKGPGEEYDLFYQQPLPPGQEVKLLEQRLGWQKIRLPGGEEMWVPSQKLEVL